MSKSKLLKGLLSTVVSLSIGAALTVTSMQVFASGDIAPLNMDGDGGSDSYSKKTYRNEYDYSASFESTIRYNGSNWYPSYMYGVTTLFNQSRSYGGGGLVASFYYSGMGQSSSGYLTQVNSSMHHYY